MRIPKLPQETADGPKFQLARRKGYDPSDVDSFIDQLEALPDTAEGRLAARKLAENVRFHLARHGGYEPSDVDEYVECVLAELEG